MGKASRKKTQRGSGERDQKVWERNVRAFLRTLGITFPSSSSSLWTQIENRLGRQFADAFEEALNDRAKAEASDSRLDSTVYDLMYRDLETAIITTSFVTPMFFARAVHLQSVVLPTGKLLDIGSGSGLLTCFYASVLPEMEVVGVEINEGGVACGRELAERLHLENVTFEHNDVSRFKPTEPFDAVISTASLIEMEGGVSLPSNPFSSRQEGQAVWDRSDVELARTAFRLTRDEGVFLTMERLPQFSEYARWVSALQTAGFSVDLELSAVLKWDAPPSGKETMTSFFASRKEIPKVDFNGLVEWYLRDAHTRDDFRVEMELFQVPSLRFVDGKHFDVRDGHGDGQTRIYILQTDTDAVLYLSTSRGMRQISRRSKSLATLIEIFNSQVSQFLGAPDVVGSRDLSASDLEKELGRTVV